MKKFSNEEIKKFVSEPLFDENVILKKDNSFPKISIVTPSFNQGQFLERTILSVLNQNYPNLEYIIMDGGSTDGSIDIIKKYEKYLTYWVSEKDNGQADAINKGFRKASGQIFAWINSDDIYLPGTLNQVSLAFKKNPKADVVYGSIYRIDPDDNIIREQRATQFLPNGYLYGGFDLAQPSVFWRREIYLRVGGMNTEYSFSMDTDLFFRFVISGAKFDFLRSFLSCLRIHSLSKTSNIPHISKSEDVKIYSIYLKHPYGSFFANLVRNIAKTKRLLLYVIQGDIGWLLDRIKRRVIKKATI